MSYSQTTSHAASRAITVNPAKIMWYPCSDIVDGITPFTKTPKFVVGIQSPFPRFRTSLYFHSDLHTLCFSQGKQSAFQNVCQLFRSRMGANGAPAAGSTYGHMLKSFITSMPPSGNDFWLVLWSAKENWCFSYAIFYSLPCLIHMLTSFLFNFTAFSLRA